MSSGCDMSLNSIYGFLGKIRVFFGLLRIRNVIISFLGVYAGALLFSLGTPISFLNVFLAASAAALILGGGNAINDYFDYEIDKINKPERPIPSGKISRSDAFMLSIVLFLIGLAISKSINPLCLGMAVINTAILLVYAKWGKNLLILSNIMISYLVASVFIFGSLAVYNPIMHINTWGINILLVLTVCSFLINLSREIIKDIEDMDGDLKNYSNTLPIKIGADNAKKISFIIALITVTISITPIVWDPPLFNELLYGIIILITNAVIIASYTTHPSLNQRMLVFSMTLALIAFMAGISPNYM